MKKEKEYGSVWVDYDDIKLGGFWAYVIGIIEDKTTHERKVRIAKGKVKGKVKRVGKDLKYNYDDIHDPIVQVNRLNIKSREEWEKIKILGDKWVGQL